MQTNPTVILPCQYCSENTRDMTCVTARLICSVEVFVMAFTSLHCRSLTPESPNKPWMRSSPDTKTLSVWKVASRSCTTCLWTSPCWWRVRYALLRFWSFHHLFNFISYIRDPSSTSFIIHFLHKPPPLLSSIDSRRFISLFFTWLYFHFLSLTITLHLSLCVLLVPAPCLSISSLCFLLPHHSTIMGSPFSKTYECCIIRH